MGRKREGKICIFGVGRNRKEKEGLEACRRALVNTLEKIECSLRMMVEARCQMEGNLPTKLAHLTGETTQGSRTRAMNVL